MTHTHISLDHMSDLIINHRVQGIVVQLRLNVSEIKNHLMTYSYTINKLL